MEQLLAHSVTIEDIEHEVRSIPGWHRIIIIGPYRTDRDISGLAQLRPQLGPELVEISNAIEQWSLVTLDERDRILSRHGIAWKSQSPFSVREIRRIPQE
jgi:hypothetical protein